MRCGLSTADYGFINIEILHESELKCVQQGGMCRSERDTAGLLKGNKVRMMYDTLISDLEDERGGAIVE